jgi:ribose 1,5-bisphosphokinase PhnN
MSAVQLPINVSDFDTRRGLLLAAVRWVAHALVYGTASTISTVVVRPFGSE